MPNFVKSSEISLANFSILLLAMFFIYVIFVVCLSAPTTLPNAPITLAPALLSIPSLTSWLSAD